MVGKSTTTALNCILGVARSSAAKYVQLLFLDISGAFNNPWWPTLMRNVKQSSLPSNIYRLLRDCFTDKRAGFFVGLDVEWKLFSMGCPQDSLLGPTLWNVLIDDMLRLLFPAGFQTVAYADDITVRPAQDSETVFNLLTKAYHTTNTVVLLVLAGVLPADLEVVVAEWIDIAREGLIRPRLKCLGVGCESS
ncbi:Retrovirus-related Pol polyprotein from type-1 retrotransposable element R1 [Eumeta japonica]|uniref:Retrovirus-related Pol polyprotein from type-1 retrotransposable element R1 n=1 Tax=Eumeta variegata TaxID=151549 RepID=A0A4C1WJ49_EUMVA|nr:Retrovirus-related Pol polyprotein from type-1 retrotransposable element R1 [Eumeta japonica]